MQKVYTEKRIEKIEEMARKVPQVENMVFIVQEALESRTKKTELEQVERRMDSFVNYQHFNDLVIDVKEIKDKIVLKDDLRIVQS